MTRGWRHGAGTMHKQALPDVTDERDRLALPEKLAQETQEKP